MCDLFIFRLFPPDLFEMFIDVGHYITEINAYKGMLHYINTATVGLVWFGLVWFGLVWFSLVWFGFWIPHARKKIVIWLYMNLAFQYYCS